MNTVWKYPLDVTATQSINVPVNAKLLTVQVQLGIPTLWALVDPLVESGPRSLRIVGTGHPEVHPDDRYIGTFQLGGFVGHLFEITPNS